MVLEGIAALGLASNIVQLVDFGSRLLSKSLELYHSSDGFSTDTLELQTIATSLQGLSRDLAHPSTGMIRLSHHEADLISLARICKGIADELLEATSQLTVQGSHRKFKSFLVALKSIWKPEKIDRLATRLDSARSQMVLCLLRSMRYIELLEENIQTLIYGK